MTKSCQFFVLKFNLRQMTLWNFFLVLVTTPTHLSTVFNNNKLQSLRSSSKAFSMSSLVTAVFKATIGLLVTKGRDEAAKRLKEGDVANEKVRGLIVREIDEINSRLDGLARKDLLASISFFKEGIELLYTFFDKARSRSEQAAAETASADAVSVAKRMRRLEIIELDESSTRALSNTKDRFKDARREATKAFANEALALSDRVLAMQYRVMATILETVDNPTDALAPCRVCIEELHCLSAVKECFAVELEKGFRSRFNKDERRTIISTVCKVNRAIYDVMLMVCFGNKEIFANWPWVDTNEMKINPLRNVGVAKVLKKKGIEHCCVPWSFGQEGKEEHRLQHPTGIATNTLGQFLVADRGDQTLKVFDSNGNFLLRINLISDNADTRLVIHDIATDLKNNTYVLVSNKKPEAKECEQEVQVFNKTADPQLTFHVTRRKSCRLTVSGSKVLVGSVKVVDVYEQDGGFVCSFGEGIFGCVTDIDAANNDRVMVFDSWRDHYLFTVEGQQLFKCTIEVHPDYMPHAWACHPAGGHVIVACKKLEGTLSPLMVEIHTTNGEFVRRIQLDELEFCRYVRVRVTMEGLIAVTFDGHRNFEAIVV